MVSHAARLGLKLSGQLAGELVACTGNAPGVIDQELRKLLDRLGGSGKPTAEQIRAGIESEFDKVTVWPQDDSPSRAVA